MRCQTARCAKICHLQGGIDDVEKYIPQQGYLYALQHG
jgi:hypothetical protein